MIRYLLLTLFVLALTSTVNAQNKPSVLLVVAENQVTYRDDVINKLNATGSFSTVDLFDANIATPVAGDFSGYDVAVVWSDNSFFDPIALGDNLASYIENGGHVITMVFASLGGAEINGAFESNYQLRTPGNSGAGLATLGTINSPLHPTVNNISNFSGGSNSFRTDGGVVSGDVIAEWSDGLPLIVAQENVGPASSRIVDLNFWPVSSDIFGAGAWDATGQGTQIMENAIIWASDPFRKVIVGEIATDIGQSYDVAWADYDNDGFQDLFVPERSGSDKLYHNNGDGTFSSVVAGDLGADADASFGASWGDYDNDGDPDLFVAVGGFVSTSPNKLYNNNGDGTFTSIVAGDLGLDANAALSGAWADYDNDGFLDLAVGNYSGTTNLYHNNGDNTFSLNPNFTPADIGDFWSVDWGDFNGDNRPDLYVSNYGGANILYRNDGGGFFSKITIGPHVIDITSNYCASWIDYDNDGDQDIFVPVNGSDNKLYVNDGTGVFTPDLTNVIVTEPGNSWSASWGDFDNDGRIDLYIGNEVNPGSLFKNNGGGNFTKATSTIVSKDVVVNGSGTLASAWTDIDNDGDLDLFTSVFSGENNFYINEINNANSWIDIKLEGTISNSSGIGAQIQLTNGNGNTAYQTVTTQNGRGQASQNAHFGLGSNSIRNITVIWPSGLAQSVQASNNQIITIVEDQTDDDRPKILLVAADDPSYVNDVREKLVNTGEFSSVSSYYAGSATPTLSDLQPFDAVFIWSDNPFQDPTTIGDNLADYIDGGGAVVRCHFSLDPSWSIGGRFASNFELIALGSTVNGAASLGFINIPDHPIMNKVSTFDGGTFAFRSNSTVANGTVIAEWSDGLPFIVAQEGVGAASVKRVDLNFWPTSSDVYSQNWVSSTDGARIMANAILWATSPTDQFTKVAPGAVLTTDLANSWGNAWGDYNGDGHLDLFVGNSGQANFLFQNNGNGTFTKNTTDPSILIANFTDAAVWGDYDNDGHLDLFVPDDGGNNILYKNDGNGALFESINFGDVDASVSASWGDYDGDGYLDLFVGNGGNNRLYHNEQDGTFAEIIDGSITDSNGYSYGTSWADYDDDGFLDLFIAEFGDYNILLHNNGDETFSRITSGEIVNDLNFSVGGSWGDYDNDADLDLFVANYSAENNSLYENNGDGTFTKIINQNIVLDASSSLGASWADFNNDGYLDLFVGTEGSENNLLYQNNGDGTFNLIKLWAPTNDPTASYGTTWADFDEDGDVDLFVTTISDLEPNLFYINNGNSNNWINIVLQGVVSNRSAIGAKIYITTENGETQFREVTSMTGFGSQNSLNVEFGLAAETLITEIEINWPSGIDQYLYDVSANQFITIIEDVVAPEVLTENFPEYFDINGSTQVASIEVSDDQSIAYVDVSVIGISQAVGNEQTIPAETNDGTTFTLDLSYITNIDDQLGIAYRFLVYDNAGNVTESNVGVTHIEIMGSTSASIPKLKFGNKVTDYQIISIPLELDNNSVSSVFEDDLGAYDDTKWRLFHYQGGNNVEKTSGSLQPDEGYWFIAASNATIDVGTGAVPQATKANPYQISLSSGWNQIGNPYNFNISWNEVLAFNGNPSGVDSQLSLYNGGFQNGDVLQRFRGAFVNASSAITLDIPVIKNNSIQGRKGGDNGRTSAIDTDNWVVDLDLRADDLVYQMGGFGMNSQALLGKDMNDLYTVPRFVEYLEVNFQRDEDYQSPLTLDIVPTAENFEWNFTVNSSLVGQELAIEWDNSYWGDSEKQLILFDKVSNTRIDMREQTEYRYSYSAERNFQLIFGDEKYVDSSLAPKDITINSAYPNPFAETLSIPIALPEYSKNYQVKLEIYDQMGRKILDNSFSDMPFGYHIVEWNGADNKGSKVTKGIYFVHLIVESDLKSENFTQRIYYK